ncbi:putative fatty acyl-CoA reductase CG5065 [Rhipicephalus sanguineus]|uniref:putative fatty acyl-CoA reductase CG5065 n=1 Tax=Rhipicephalus sanguineus TaxID=34632 RepID=UPI0020C4E984|nr:putative fatty acyl-CoA reductase CG5065 [Rhipicephalus sanguineus]
MAARVSKQPQCLTSTADEERKDGSKVASFYYDRVVFITGGTGFIGKVLLEKLLRSCPGLKRVYLLVRSKRGENPQARLEKMFDSKMFEHLKQEQPDALKKVTALAGDLTEPNLGLSASDQATLVNSVSVVFHSGATIRFDEPLRRAVLLNVLGTRSVLDLSEKMTNLSAFVHVSTAYCNCDKPDVLEIIYPPPVGAQKLIEAAQSSSNDTTVPEEDCLYGHPNTYTLTKSVAESLILEERGEMPVAIVRPSIVTASIKEPLPGWVDNYNGCTRTIYVRNYYSRAKSVPKDIEVYHCTSSALNPCTWAYIADETQRAIWRHPLPNVIRFPKFQVTNSHMWHDVNLWCLHYLPARVVDLALNLYGQKPRFVCHYKKIRKTIDSVRYFQTHEWLFRSNNVSKLLQELSPTDARLFNIDVQRLDWRSYFEGYVLGIRRYLLKAEDSELPEARKRLKRLNVMRWFLYSAMAMISCGVVAMTTTTWDMYNSVCGFATGLCDMVGL